VDKHHTNPASTIVENTNINDKVDNITIKDNNRQHKAVQKKGRQETQALYMKKLQSDTSKKAMIGSIVTIQMDARDVPHPNAVLGIAFKISKSAAGGCLIATEHGTIVKDGKKPVLRTQIKI
jgi:hypothetical protein